MRHRTHLVTQTPYGHGARSTRFAAGISCQTAHTEIRQTGGHSCAYAVQRMKLIGPNRAAAKGQDANIEHRRAAAFSGFGISRFVLSIRALVCTLRDPSTIFCQKHKTKKQQQIATRQTNRHTKSGYNQLAAFIALVSVTRFANPALCLSARFRCAPPKSKGGVRHMKLPL